MDIKQTIQKPWNIKPNGYYEENTGDIKENQILAWTLFILLLVAVIYVQKKSLQQCGKLIIPYRA